MSHAHDERITAWLDDELDAAEAEQVAAEIARDPELAARVERLERARRLVRSQGPVAAPRGFSDRVLDRLDEEPVRHPAQLLGVSWQGWALAAVAVLVLALALPRTVDAPDVRPAASPGTTEIDALSVTSVVLVSPTWQLSTGASDAQVARIVDGAGGRLETADGTLLIQVPAEQVVDLRTELAALGTLTDVGAQRQAAGRVQITLERVP